MSATASTASFFARIIELPKRIFKYEKRPQVVYNGESNDYAERVQLLNENSITASQCRTLYRKFIFGQGLVNQELADREVGGKENPGYTIERLVEEICDEFSEQHGFAVHVQYDIEGKPSAYNVWPFVSVRLGLHDSKDKPVMIAKSDDWIDENLKKDKIRWYYPFNPHPEIVKDQILREGGINKYQGQVFFFNPYRTKYPLAPIHAVMNDADSEFRSSVYKNKSLRKGFFGKNILVTQPLVDTVLSQTNPKDLDESTLHRLREQEKARTSVVDALKGFVGVENHEGFMHLEIEHTQDDISKAISHVSIPTDIDDKLFAHTEESCSNNIRKAYGNVPRVLVENTDAAVFSDSGSQLMAAKTFYQEQTEGVRIQLQRGIYALLKPLGIEKSQVELLPLINTTTPAE